MSRSPLGPKSSSAQLWTEVQRLRTSGEDERLAELTSELERARARERAALDEVTASRMAASESGLSEESFAGKPSLTKLRKTWTEFVKATMRLPLVRRQGGLGAVRFACATELLGDLDLFELDAPHGRIASLMRDLLRRELTHPAKMAALSDVGGGADYHRTLFLSSVARYYLRPSVWKTYEKASDEGLRDALGTVYK